ncbi:MAG TPA: hypothetical protein VMD30_10375 [Tepidisphaeraceae bacterium]|nr:hypothetical protein [Tepidisphaeraceae bacterium]
MQTRWLACALAILPVCLAAAQTTAPATEPAADPIAAANQNTPHGAIEVSLIAMFLYNADAARSVYAPSDALEGNVIDAMVAEDKIRAQIEMEKKKLFASDYTDPLAPLRADLLKMFALLDQATETINGDTATCTYQLKGQQQRTLVKIDGRWCLPLDEAYFFNIPADVRQQPKVKALMRQLFTQELLRRNAEIAALKQYQRDLRSGQYLSLDEADDAMAAAQDEAIAHLQAKTQPALNP